MFTFPVIQLAPGPGGFPITDQLAALWDAALGVSESGGSISAWADQSGNGEDWTSVNNPTLSTSVLNSLPVVTFDGTNDLMSQAAFLSGTSTDAEMFCVCRRTSSSNKGWHCFGSSTSQPHMMYGNALYETFGAAERADAISHGANLDLDEWGLYNVSKVGSNGTLTVRINGTSQYSTARNSGWNGTFYLGSGNTGGTTGSTHSCQGQLAEMAVWSKVLSTGERTSVYDYFNSKYALGL